MIKSPRSPVFVRINRLCPLESDHNACFECFIHPCGYSFMRAHCCLADWTHWVHNLVTILNTRLVTVPLELNRKLPLRCKEFGSAVHSPFSFGEQSASRGPACSPVFLPHPFSPPPSYEVLCIHLGSSYPTEALPLTAFPLNQNKSNTKCLN